MSKPIVWTIAGSDSGGGAGIQADLQAIHTLGGYGCSVITAITSQNSFSVDAIHITPSEHIVNQINALAKDLPASAIKIGLIGDQASIKVIGNYLQNYKGKVVCDPVMVATSGAKLMSTEVKELYVEYIFPYIDILTPNLHETEAFLGYAITSTEDYKKAARDLIALGVNSVIIKGGHNQKNEKLAADYWSDGHDSFWLATLKYHHNNTHGSGCTFSSAIAVALARGYTLKDALTIAKMYVTQGIRLAEQYGDGPGAVVHYTWPQDEIDLPMVSMDLSEISDRSFPECNNTKLSLYPIVDSVDWLLKLLPLGVSTIQLRIKDKSKTECADEIKYAVALASKYNTRLFINDYWELAIAHGAYGVHLGQEDILTADFAAIRAAGLRLGISTHCYYEVARAHAYRPSYIACGPIYATTSKAMEFFPQGLTQLSYWRNVLSYPLVAIGGINQARLLSVLKTGIDGVALISEITQAVDPVATTQQLLTETENYQKCFQI